MKPNVVVIGAGIVGASIAYHLVKEPTKVIIIDKGEPANDISGLSFAWINAYEKDPYAYHLLSRLAVDTWPQFSATLGNEIDYRKGGCIFFFDANAPATTLIKRVKKLQQWGYNINTIDKDRLANLLPDLRIDTNSYLKAAHAVDEACVNSKLVTQICIKKAEKLGAKLLLNSPVVKLHSHNNRITFVETENQKIPCDVVILAAGRYLAEIAKTVN